MMGKNTFNHAGNVLILLGLICGLIFSVDCLPPYISPLAYMAAAVCGIGIIVELERMKRGLKALEVDR